MSKHHMSSVVELAAKGLRWDWERICPADNQYRQYGLEVSRDLFGSLIVKREWGRVGLPMRSQIICVGQFDDAAKTICSEIRKRQRHHYVLVAIDGRSVTRH